MTLAIQTLLDAALEAVTDIPTVQVENTNVNTVGAITPWVRGTLLPSRSTPLTIGVGAMKTMSGLYQVDCFYPRAQGSEAGRTMADAIVAAFPMGLQLTDGTITVNIVMASVLTTRPGSTTSTVNYPVEIEWTVYTQGR